MGDVTKWMIAAALTLVMGAAFIQADARWLRHVEFDSWAQAQVQRDNQSELRATDRRITDVQGELQYGTLTPERRAQLEQLLALLMAQKAELEALLNAD